MKIGRLYSFEAAHWIPTVPEGHKCLSVHGHQYRVEVVAEGPIEETGMVIDFADLDGMVNPVIDELDHTTLNHIRALDIPTAEVISNYILHRLPPLVVSVTVWENDRSWAMAER